MAFYDLDSEQLFIQGVGRFQAILIHNEKIETLQGEEVGKIKFFEKDFKEDDFVIFYQFKKVDAAEISVLEMVGKSIAYKRDFYGVSEDLKDAKILFEGVKIKKFIEKAEKLKSRKQFFDNVVKVGLAITVLFLLYQWYHSL